MTSPPQLLCPVPGCGRVFKNKKALTTHGNAHRRSSGGASGTVAKDHGQEQSKPADVTILFSEEAHSRARALVNSVTSAAAIYLQQDIPETPSPAQQLVMGHNIRNFETAQLSEPHPSFAKAGVEPSKNIQAMLSQSAMRTLWFSCSKDKHSGLVSTIRIRNYEAVKPSKPEHEQIDLRVQKLLLDLSTGTDLGLIIRRLLARIPLKLRALNQNHRQWLVDAGYQVLKFQQPTLKPQLEMPELVRSPGRGEWGTNNRSIAQYAFWANGYNPVKAHGWRTHVMVKVGTLDLQREVPLDDENQFDWVGAVSALPQDLAHFLSDKDFEQALKVAKLLSMKYLGFIGTADDLTSDVKTTTRRFWPIQKQQRRTAQPKETDAKWIDQPIWNIDEVTDLPFTQIKPSSWLSRHITGKPFLLHVDSIECERVLPVLNAIVDAMKANHTHDVAWGIGAAVADEQNRNLSELPLLILDCNEEAHSDEVHVCPSCYKTVRHRDLESNEIYPYKICGKCRDTTLEPNKKDPVKGGVLGFDLFVLLQKENKAAKTGLSLEQLKKLSNVIWNTLQHLVIDDHTYVDGYVKQLLDTKGTTALAWDGRRLNPTFPSIEAIDPVVVGDDGKTRYHVAENITLTSYSINGMLKHYPKVLLNGILQIVESTKLGRKSYESGIGVFRNCLINYYEVGHFGGPQQMYRVGQDPPKNMAAILRSFRTAELLPRTIPKEQVWRCYQARKIGSLNTRLQFRPLHYQWLLQQLDWIAEEVFGADAPKYRPFWMRRDSAGVEVFFPFSQYSVVIDFTWWDLQEIISVKGYRNINACQKSYSSYLTVTPASDAELILVIANVWMRMIKADADKGLPDYDYGRDEAGFVPHPNICWLLCASLGHRWHGKVMELSLSGFDTKSWTKVKFDPAKCGFLWETQLCNFFKFKYADSQIPAIMSQLRNIRRGDPPGETRSILPAKDIHIGLRDELAFELSADTVAAAQLLDPRMGNQARLQEIGIADAQAETEIAAALQGVDNEADVGVDSKAIRKGRQRPGQDKEGSFEISSDADSNESSDDSADNGNDADVHSEYRQTPDQSDLPAVRSNMTNLGNTCYAGVSMQVLANIPEIKAALVGDAGFVPITGRYPNMLENCNDFSGGKHQELYDAVSDIVKSLTSGGEKLHAKFTANLLTASNALNPSWKNENNDAAQFYSFLLDAIDLITDQSKAIDEPDFLEKLADGTFRRRPAFRPEEKLFAQHQDDVRQGAPLMRIQDQLSQHWAAHLASGHKSSITELAGVQYVEILRCESEECISVLRNVRHAKHVVLRFPERTDGLIFAVEISRQHPLGGTNSPFMNRVEGYEQINLEDWSNRAPGPHKEDSDPTHHKEFEHPSCASVYETVAVAAFSDKIQHYTVFVKVDGVWAYFDDLQSHPVVRDPFTQWPESFVETMIWFRQKGDWAPSKDPEQVAGTQLVLPDTEMREADEALRGPVDDEKVYSENELNRIVAQAVAQARLEEEVKTRRQFKEEATKTSKAHIDDIRWHEQKVQQLEQQLRDRDSVPAAFAQPLNEAAISALSGQEVAQLYRQCSEFSRHCSDLSRQCSEALRLIGPRVEAGLQQSAADEILQQSARSDRIDTATEDEADIEPPSSNFATIRKGKGKGKKFLDGLKGLTRSGTLKGKESRRSSIGDTFSRIKATSKSTLGLDKSSDDAAATDESTTSSPSKSSTLEPPTTPTNRPSADAKTLRTRRKRSKNALKTGGPVLSRDSKEDGSTTETSLTDATAGASPTPAKRRQQRPLIDTMAHSRRAAGLARASQDALSLPPTPDRGLQPQRSHAVLGSRPDETLQQSRKRALSDARLSFGGLASDPFRPGPYVPSSATQQASLHRTSGRRGLSAEFRQQAPTAGDQPAVQEGERVTEVLDSEEDRYGSAIGSSPPHPPEDDMNVD
ncbi:hypothetical protein LTR72_006636 [Exophiala xenobiotica]|nr:hypothetical protein LTR72_006636 [Exophiala xenobiotica]KAK5287232.1 hypothetical protein LTR14_009296 [Exophiala xenobiotica]KAK5475349.1 hypothetical protein LTR55_009353 [Exophiala xenobiotica]